MELEYSDGYLLHCQLRLNSGRRVYLTSLRQWLTYAGLLEGTPTKRINDRLIQDASRDAGYLIPPTRRDYMRTPGDMKEEAVELHIPEWLPAVTCVAEFTDVWSSLKLVWFQDEFALPICEPALSEFRQLDWDGLAKHFGPDDL